MRPLWILACTLAVIGAFFLALQIAWSFGVKPTWLPYPIHLIGAAAAGLALCASAPARSLREPLLGGVLAVLVLAAISFGLPQAFTLTAARAAQPWLVLPAVAAVSGLCCAGGAWLALRREAAGTSRGAIVVAVAMTAACAIHLGGRVAYALGVPAEPIPLLVVGGIAAVVAAAAVQAIVEIDCTASAAVAGAALVAWSLLHQSLTERRPPFNGWTLLLVIVVILGAALGARVVSRTRPRPTG